MSKQWLEFCNKTNMSLAGKGILATNWLEIEYNMLLDLIRHKNGCYKGKK